MISMVHVFVTAIVLLLLSWTLIVAPTLAAQLESKVLDDFMQSPWVRNGLLYAVIAAIIGGQLFAAHLYLAAGKRTIAQVWPGVVLTLVLWSAAGWAYSIYLGYSNYTRFYAGLSQLMIALIFFQLTAVIIILGAELNRGLIEFKKMRESRKAAAEGGT